MDFNKDKYYVENSDLLTEAEKIQLAKDLLELERRGILECRDGAWVLADGVEVEETPTGPVARLRKTECAIPGQLATGSVTSSGEPSETRVPPLSKAARPSAEGSRSPDSNDQDSKR